MAGFGARRTQARFPRQPTEATGMGDVRAMFDGYDTGVRYADDHIGRWLNALADAGVLDETAVMVSSDHGETLGELGTYCDRHLVYGHASHVVMALRWHSVTGGEGGNVAGGLHYQLDVAATVAELAGAIPVAGGDGESFAAALVAGDEPAGREHLILSHGAQRAVRTGDWLYLHTYHDGFHGLPETLLFDLASDPHEEHDLAASEPEVCAEAEAKLVGWREGCLADSPTGVDPLDTVLEEGGPWHVRGHLLEYAERLRSTGRGTGPTSCWPVTPARPRARWRAAGSDRASSTLFADVEGSRGTNAGMGA
jgi:arylsulfatase A-like enzyme